MIIKGRVIKFGDSIDTDVIIPARFLSFTDEKILGSHAFEDYSPSFRERVKSHPIIVAGKNFGCGSSREHAVLALKGAGVKVVVAESFARIFFRNAINLGLPPLEVEGVGREIDDGDLLEIDLENSIVRDKTKDKTFKTGRLPDFILSILKAGGMANYIREHKGEW